MPVQTNKHAGIRQLSSGKYQARARNAEGVEVSKTFTLLRDAKAWQASVIEKRARGVSAGTVDHKLTVTQWCDQWLDMQKSKRPTTFNNSKSSAKRISAYFGGRRLVSIKPSDVKKWIVSLQEEGLKPSTIHVLHGTLSSIFSAAVHDDLISKNPCSSRTSPKSGEAKRYVCTMEQVWALYEAVPEIHKNAILLGAFAGLRVGEAVAVHPVHNVDWDEGLIQLTHQREGRPLKTARAGDAIAVPKEMLELMRSRIAQWREPQGLVLNQYGRPCSVSTLETSFKEAAATVPGLPEGFTFHDLRHFYASTLIAAGLDIKTIQYQMRHEKAATTLDTYGHLMEGKKESARAAVTEVFAAHADFLRS